MQQIPAEAFYDVTRVTDVAVAPDGDRIAVLTREYAPDDEETVDSLWVVPADGARKPHRLTRASDAGNPAWGPDGDRLGFVAARETDPGRRVGRKAGDDDADADEEPKPQVWVFDLARGGDARQVTDREEGVADFDWSPDGEALVVAARDPTDEEREYLQQRRDDGPVEIERLQHKFDGEGYLDEVTTYLFVVDAETGAERRLDAANDGGYGGFFGGLQPAWGPGGRIAFVANHADWPDDTYARDVYSIDPEGGERRRLTDGTLAAAAPAWAPDGDRLAFSGQPPDNWYVPREVYVADPDGGAVESVSAGLDRTLARGAEPLWVDGRTLVSLVADEGRTRPARFGVDADPERVFEVQDGLETLASLDTGGGTAAFVTSRPDEGADVYAVGLGELDAATDPRTRLTAFNDDLLGSVPTPGCERMRFESDDGTDIEAVVYYPEDFDPSDPDERGLILDIHGGPMSYDEPEFRFQDAFFASRGYVVAKVNYRGSTSYGRAFCEVLKGAWGTVDVEDLSAGVDALVERGWADPERLFPTGFSQGGVNTAYLVTREDRWAAAAAEHGVYDLRSDFGTADAQNWYEADYGLPWENPERYDEHSSITDVGGVETPLLVTAGEEDWRCPPSQSEQLYVSVRKQGVDAKLVVYPDEHHDVGDPDRAIHRLEELDGWFAEYDPARERGG